MSDSLTIHHEREKNPDISTPDTHQDTYSKTVLGFWIYLMTDSILFATLFITYAVLHNSTFGGPTAKDIYTLERAFLQTMILLSSSITCGFMLLSAVKSHLKNTLLWLGATFLLGALFLYIEVDEFVILVNEGYSWKVSAFLSSFFTIIGAHGLHISVGLLWAAVMMGQLFYQGVNVDTFRRLVVFGLFWHFLEFIWIFVFTFVYLIGVM